MSYFLAMVPSHLSYRSALIVRILEKAFSSLNKPIQIEMELDTEEAWIDVEESVEE